MTFQGFAASVQAAVFTDATFFGEEVTYTTAAGVESTINALLERIPGTFEEEFSDGFHRVRRANAVVLSADVATPGLGDKLTFDSRDWFVDEHLGDDGVGGHKLALVSFEPGVKGSTLISRRR